MFLPVRQPKDYDCGLNIELMIDRLPYIQNQQERIEYARRIVGLIKQSHINWVERDGSSKRAWDYFFQLAPFDLNELGIHNPFITGEPDLAR
jgi:hypothetical protein